MDAAWGHVDSQLSSTRDGLFAVSLLDNIREKKRRFIIDCAKKYFDSASGTAAMASVISSLGKEKLNETEITRLVENYVLARACDSGLTPEKFVSEFLNILRDGKGRLRIRLSVRLWGLSPSDCHVIPGQICPSETEILRFDQDGDTYRMIYLDEYDDSIKKELVRWGHPLGARGDLCHVLEVESDTEETILWRGVHDEKVKALMLDKARKFVGALVLAGGDKVIADVAILEPVYYHPYFQPYPTGKVFDNSEFDHHEDKRIEADDIEFMERILSKLLDDTQDDTSTAFRYLTGSYEWKNDLGIKNVLLVSALEKLLLNVGDDELGAMKKRLPRLVAGDASLWGGVVDGKFDDAYGFRCHAVHYQNSKRIDFDYLRDVLRPLVKKSLVASLSLGLGHDDRVKKLNGLDKTSGIYAIVDSYGWRS